MRRPDLKSMIERGDISVADIMTVIMSTGNNDVRQYNPSVDRTGDKIIIPDGAHLPDVIRSLERKHRQEEEVITVRSAMNVTPWDGAMALTKAIESQFGVLNQRPDRYGDLDKIEIEVGLNETIKVPFGRFELPGMEDGEVNMGFGRDNGKIIFSVTISCKRKYESRVNKLLDEVREICKTTSLHRGKAFTIEFHNSEGEQLPLPKPKFFRMSTETPVFRTDLVNSIERNVFSPIRFKDQLQSAGKSLKRGVLFAGPYGTGKTMMATYIAREAIANGWTFIYVKNSEELQMALEYAQQYQPVVVFAEDVDRVAGLERSDDVNDLLNQLDGIDSKAQGIMTILTSNHVENINPAMKRPGRIDVIVPVFPPDASTVEKMIRQFAGDRLPANADIRNVGVILDGENAARIRETISRAELETLRRTGDINASFTSDDLENAANEVKSEGALFTTVKPDNTNVSTKALADGFESAAIAVRRSLNGTGGLHAVQ